MNFKLITLRGDKVDDEIYEVMLPTADGEIAVFPGHEPLITMARAGVVRVRRKKSDPDEALELYAISGGIIEVVQNGVKLLVDEADHGDDIIEAESKAALERAIHLRDTAKSQVELEKAHELIDRHQVRLHVAGLRRHKRR